VVALSFATTYIILRLATTSQAVPEEKQKMAHTETRPRPSQGLVYYFHVGKTGGTFLSNSFTAMAAELPSFDLIRWKRGGKSKEEIIQTLDNLAKNNYNNRLTVFEHHHGYPAAVEIFDLLLQHKKRANANGFVFDIIITLRNSLDLQISMYNYFGQNYPEGVHSRTFEDFMFYNPIASYIYGSYPSYIPNNPLLPTNKEDFYPEIELQEVYSVFRKLDMIFFTKHLEDDMARYFNCLGIPFVPSPNLAETTTKYVTKDMLSLDIIEKFYATNALDQMVLAKVVQDIMPSQPIRSKSCFKDFVG